LQTAVLVATPGALAEVLSPPQPQPVLDAARFLVIDEVDACLAVRILNSNPNPKTLTTFY